MNIAILTINPKSTNKIIYKFDLAGGRLEIKYLFSPNNNVLRDFVHSLKIARSELVSIN